ncbi:MAG: hypothetical protein NXH78_05985 [Hyphomonadaceae bacterium]|nr:hypothetical protein [Hyphomonadaceae bacterium]
MAPLFDAYIIVDWSAAARPVSGANSIWIGVRTRTADGISSFTSENPHTRLAARRRVLALAEDCISRGQRVLIGFDFAMGYPAGTAEAIGLDVSAAPPWRAMHDYLARNIAEREDNSNTRFDLAAELNAAMTGRAHPFWGAPASRASETLSARKGDFSSPDSLHEHRLAEAWIRSTFKAYPKSVWQLVGAGAVGSQSLLGIATVAELRDQIPGAQLWPFETGLAEFTAKSLENTSCILAEVYPSTVPVAPKSGEILDQAQVRTLSERLESLDSAGILGGAFDSPDSISGREKHRIIAEEGWILAK